MSSVSPANAIERKTTTVPAGGADTLIDVGTILKIDAILIEACPVDCFFKFGSTGASSVPVSAGEARNDLYFPAIYAHSTTGGSVVTETHGRI
jgi:hypothetical protein